ncbi:peptidylprolyl isomerase [Actinophytocola sp. NPDC049390]|uniref:peptidylprolyl isomerase n=1 Tax=Actinophytocola sp. NPDC049390 TaxID=3363894 RepID=UPI0037AA4B6E
MSALRTAAVVAAAALTLAGCVARENPSTRTGSQDTPVAEDTATDAGGAPTGGDCAFAPDESGAEPVVGMPPDEGPVDATTLSLSTSAGPVTIEFDADRAPCTVQSMAFLAGEGYFDGTTCHRLTTSEGLKVLQCGDPKGDGTGGPGYVVPDEFPTDLEPVETEFGSAVKYARGLVAMANAGPGTTGSQFFLVYGDSTLPPDYTVFGTMDASSLATLDAIAAGGLTPGPNGPQDGTPVTPVEIESAEVA